MPTSFKQLVGTKSQAFFNTETQLEKARIYTFYPGTDFTTMSSPCFCWVAPCAGIAQIEVWGAGGSTARGCCCGIGTPGNPGAYARKTIKVQAGCYVYGYPGYTTGDGNTLCFKDCGNATCVTWNGNFGQSGCICAQGGAGGWWICSTTPSGYCCFLANGWCGTLFTNGCGIICNKFSGMWCAQAYGGDVNMPGGNSCVSFYGCLPSCPCLTYNHIALPPYMFADCGGMITYTHDADPGYSKWSGNGLHQIMHNINGISRSPGGGVPWNYCWSGGNGCGCYENEACTSFIPYGVGASPPMVCPDVRDVGRRGGFGMVRIKFIAG